MRVKHSLKGVTKAARLRKLDSIAGFLIREKNDGCRDPGSGFAGEFYRRLCQDRLPFTVCFGMLFALFTGKLPFTAPEAAVPAV